MLLSIRAVSRRLRVDYRAIKAEIAAGNLPAVRIGRRFRIDDALLQRWLAGEAVQKPQSTVVR